LGHEGCGAVQAAVATRDQNTLHRSRIQILVGSLLPGLPENDPVLSEAENLSNAVEGNVRWTVQQILDSPEGRARTEEGRMRIIGAIYEIATGRVRFLDH